MIQRIQTVYLLIVAIFMGADDVFFCGTFLYGNKRVRHDKSGCYCSGWNYELCSLALFAILMVVAILSLVTIFLYRSECCRFV